MNEFQSIADHTSSEAGATRPHLYSEDSDMKQETKEHADFLLASCLRQTNEGLGRPKRRKNEIRAAIIEAFGLVFLAAVLATKL